MMSKCSNCNAELPQSIDFCKRCGAIPQPPQPESDAPAITAAERAADSSLKYGIAGVAIGNLICGIVAVVYARKAGKACEPEPLPFHAKLGRGFGIAAIIWGTIVAAAVTLLLLIESGIIK